MRSRLLPFVAASSLALPALTLPACGTEPSWDRCTDAACYTRLAVERWPADPEGVAADIAALDVVAQEAVVLALVDAQPMALAAICQSLSVGPAAQRCEKLTERPHLLGGKANKALRQVGVPGLTDHTGIAALANPWAEQPAREADCDMQVDSCWSRTMVTATQTGDPSAVAQVCNGVSNERFRRECFFRAAETTAVQQAHAKVDRLPTAAALCLGAEEYSELCVRELGRAIARLAPAADQPDRDAWEQTAAAVAALEQGLVPYDPAVAERVADRVWSAVVWGSFNRAQVITGVPLEVLPTAAGPHVRATATWFLVEREAAEHPERDLSAWVERATAALADRSPGPQQDSQQGVQPTRFVGNSTDPAADPQPWVHYLGDNYRRVLDSPEQDLTACVLEAAARKGLPTLLEQAAQDSWPEPVRSHAAALQVVEIKAPRVPGPKGSPAGADRPPPGADRPPPPGTRKPPPAGASPRPAGP